MSDDNVVNPSPSAIVVNPSPSAIVESLRSIGYTLETAVADIIDNSITAEATQISIDTVFQHGQTSISIWDNGKGMDEDTLINAMRLGSVGPSAQRSAKDLGRFGLGLKTASLSQCRRFLVISKKDGGIVVAKCWDIDVIIAENRWHLIDKKDLLLQYQKEIDKISSIKQGTLIIWEKLDRIISDSTGKNGYIEKIDGLRSHLGLIFHRFIEKKNLEIKICGGLPIPALNPFLFYNNLNNGSTIPIEHYRNVSIKGYILPHKDKLYPQEYIDGGLGKGWTKMQGFYIYRGDRLIVAGDWLNLKVDGIAIKKDRYHDLARIEINISNEDDQEWQLDVMKSRIIVPDWIRPHLETIAKNTRIGAYNAYTYRDPLTKKKKGTINNDLLWEECEMSNGFSLYEVNRNHPMIKHFADELSNEQKKEFLLLLKLISQTIPIDNIGLKTTSEGFSGLPIPLSDISDEKEHTALVEQMIDIYVSQGLTNAEAKDTIKNIFNVE